MNQESAVDFPGQYRVHVGLTVSDLEASKQFYSHLLGVAPCKERPGYVKFEPADPSLNLSLNETRKPVVIEGGASHFGIQVKSVAEVRCGSPSRGWPFPRGRSEDLHRRSDHVLLCRAGQGLGGRPGRPQMGNLCRA